MQNSSIGLNLYFMAQCISYSFDHVFTSFFVRLKALPIHIPCTLTCTDQKRARAVKVEGWCPDESCEPLFRRMNDECEYEQ
jgi:hypothetical protein